MFQIQHTGNIQRGSFLLVDDGLAQLLDDQDLMEIIAQFVMNLLVILGFVLLSSLKNLIMDSLGERLLP